MSEQPQDQTGPEAQGSDIPPADPVPPGGAVPPPGKGGSGEPGGPGEPGAQPDATPPDKDARMMGMLAHVLGIVLGPIGPLIIWLVKKDESPFVDDQGKESLNFQLTFLIVWVAVFIITVVTCGIGGLLAPVVLVVVVVFCILAGVAANNGERYRYPINIRFIK